MNFSLPFKIGFAKNKYDKEKTLRILGIAALILGLTEPFFYPTTANAVSVTGYVRLERMKAGQATGGTICMTPSLTHTTSNNTVTVSFSNGDGSTTGFTLNATGSNWTATTSNLPTGSTAWPGITAATPTVSGQTVTYTMASNQTLTAATQYCFNFPTASTLTSRGTAASNLTGAVTATDTTPANNEVVNYATATISDDRIVVTATVPATFSFSLGAFTAALGSLPTSGAPNTATAITATVSTNAQNGWLSWAKNTNATSSLTSASTGDGVCFGGNYPTCTGAAYQTTSANVHSLSGAAGYGLSVAAGSGAPTVAPEYAGSATSFGSLDNAKFEQIASKNTVAAANTFTLTFGAEATATNKAATDYTDTVTISAAGQF